jgi:hypothetical protein
VIFYGVGQNFFLKKSPNDLGKILAMKKSPKIDLNKAKILFQKRFFTCLKNIQKIISPFLCKKTTIKECPVPLDIGIKSNIKHHKTVLYSKSNKHMVGRLFGQFFIVFGQFFHKNIWSPWLQPLLVNVKMVWKGLPGTNSSLPLLHRHCQRKIVLYQYLLVSILPSFFLPLSVIMIS